ncbi:unnamed protein product [Bursaphelenchus okinawaensis]|uniref:Glutathione S-transferase kappa n=1 Tax=Bursaphelenchus okinawaensis TaxID=465554 RepID=A0A811LH46_9BILA|nr:unnamed protein product [Bursaphelenchus okinawaensis]CAG9122275.1 unnamed protein product [Bursaphelenchus okinawaensis]
MTEGVLDFYFDIVSPYAFLAYQIIRDHEANMNLKINFHPVSMAAVFRLTKNVGPGLIPLKFQYLRKSLIRLSEYWDVEHVVMPNWFEEKAPTMSSIMALRVITYIKEHYPEELDRTVRAFWSRMFHDHKPNFLPADVDELLEELGFDHEIRTLAESEENRSKLRDTVTREVKEGGFGVPYMVLRRQDQDVQNYFGVESIPLLFKELGIVKSEPIVHAKL